MSSKPQECNRCKEAGYTGQMITFAKDGTKQDGSIKWKPVNLDGSTHIHKTHTEQPKADTNSDVLTKELTLAINHLANAVEALARAKQ